MDDRREAGQRMAPASSPLQHASSAAGALFDVLPQPALMLDSGRVAGVNRALRALLGPATPTVGSACCDVLGCRDAPGGCICDAPPSERPVSVAGVPATAEVAALWDGSSALLVLFRGLRPATMDREKLTICALGPLVVWRGKEPLGDDWFGRRPGQLLKLLVAHRNRWLHAEEISEALWPLAGARGLNSLRFHIHVLRRHLDGGPARRGETSFLRSSPSGYRLDPERVEIDAEHFEGLVDAGLTARDPHEALLHLRKALAVHRGDFLADDRYADWAFGERERLRGLLAGALRGLVGTYERLGHTQEAARYAQQLADLDPFDTGAQRELVRICLVNGRRSEAVRRYAALCARLRNEFGDAPDFTMAEVAAEAGRSRHRPPAA